MSDSPSRLLREFHTHVGASIRTSPTVAVEDAMRRCDFIDEEAAELRTAVEAGDVVGVADALGDLVYVVYGAALQFGIDLDAVVAEVHHSNMTKTPAGDGKAVKGPGYLPPDLNQVVATSAAKRTQSGKSPHSLPRRNRSAGLRTEQ